MIDLSVIRTTKALPASRRPASRVSHIVGALLVLGTALVASVVPSHAGQPGIQCVQNQLNALGFDAGVPDGSFGPRTSAAAEQYRQWMVNGGGDEGWNEPPLSGANGEAWCARVASDHPEVARFVQPDHPFVDFAASGPGGLVASFDLPVGGRIKAWELTFVFKTECENDHWASIQSPAGDMVIVMDRGLHRCSGTPKVFTGSTRNAPPFMETEASGTWQLVFKDLDANFYSGFLMQARLNLTVENDGVLSRRSVRFDGLPKAIPNPT